MANEVIQLDAKELASKIVDQLSTETVGELIKRVLKSQFPKEEEIRRDFDWAVEKVAKEYFVNYLQNDAKFVAKLKSEMEKQLTADLVQQAIKKVGERVIRGY